MMDKLKVLIVVLCMLSYADAGTVSIGTASARGDLRVDSYMVKDSATLFDGSVIETGQASADLHLGQGTEIRMASSSRGTLYRDHLVIQQGASELSASSAFKLEAGGLSVVPREPSSHVVVSLRAGNTVEVAASAGSFGVMNDQGILLASVRPGQSLSFALQAGGSSSSFAGTGVLSTEGGNYFITVGGVKYQVTGKDLAKKIGKKVTVTGSIISGVTPAAGATAVILISSVSIMAGITTGWIVGGTAIGASASAGIGYAVHAANHMDPPASR
jgi:hypothetical protein